MTGFVIPQRELRISIPVARESAEADAGSMMVDVARTDSDIQQCRALIADVYGEDYGVCFRDGPADFEAHVERWPDRFIVGRVAGHLVATMGIYLRDTSVQRHGNVTDQEIARLLREAGVGDRFDVTRTREFTKLSIAPRFRRRGAGRLLVGAAHSGDFLQMGSSADRPHLLLTTARRSIWEGMFHANGIRTRRIKDYPNYGIVDKYRSDQDPMDSRLVIPDIDVPWFWADRSLPCAYALGV
jgi:hypothetical protein